RAAAERNKRSGVRDPGMVVHAGLRNHALTTFRASRSDDTEPRSAASSMSEPEQGGTLGRDARGVTAEGEALPSDPRRIRYLGTPAPAAGSCARITDGLLWASSAADRSESHQCLAVGAAERLPRHRHGNGGFGLQGRLGTDRTRCL